MDCGPGVRLSLRLTGPVIEEASFEVRMMPAARAAASALCAVLHGATVAQARGISARAIARLAGLPETSAAVRYVLFAKSAVMKPLLLRAEFAALNVTCTCFAVDESTIRETACRVGACTVADLRCHLPVTMGCGSCRPEVEAILREVPEPD